MSSRNQQLAGVDLAWHGEVNSSAIAIGSFTDDTLTVSSLHPAIIGNAGVVELLLGTIGLVGVAIDAPLIINNQGGQRPCEKEVGQTFGSRGASCHTSNLKLYPSAGSVRLSEVLKTEGFDHCQGNRWQMECYPHTAIIEIFGLPRRLKYKKGRVDDKRKGQVELASHIQSLSFSSVLKLSVPSRFERILDPSHIYSLGGRALKANEDALDALLCLYIAGLYALGCQGRLFGDRIRGYIWVPMVKCV